MINDIKPDEVWLLGDIMDAEEIKRFEGDPNNPKFTEEIGSAGTFLDDLQRVSPKSRKVWMDGNHEYRLTKWLWAMPMFARERLVIGRLLSMEKRKIEYHPYEDGAIYVTDTFIAEHGDKTSKHSSYTARAMTDARGISGISGHTHRLGAFHRNDYGGGVEWYENGCLRDLHPDWIMSKPNWQHGFHVGYFKGNEYHITPYKIKSGSVLHNGSIFSAKEWKP